MSLRLRQSQCQRQRQRHRLRPGGFTLVEVLVALFLMALLSTLAWQGLNMMLRARDSSTATLDRTLRTSTVLTQWEQDLQAVLDTGVVPALVFDGQTLRLTRRGLDGVQVVAWSVRSGRWQRWASLPLTRAGELQDQWLRSLQLLGTEPGHVEVAQGASAWQIYYYRGNAWTNAQSTGDVVQAAATSASDAQSGREALPDGVRLVITLDDHPLTRDIALEAGG